MKHRKNSHLPHWCCAIGIAFWGCHRSTPQRVTSVSIAAADQGAVVVVEGDAPRAFAIDAIDASGAQRWRTWLDCGTTPTAAAFADRVFVRCRTHGRPAVERISAFALNDGHEVWKHDEKATSDGSLRAVRLVGDGIVADGNNRALILNARDGSLRLIYPSKQTLRAPVVDGTKLVYVGLSQVVVVDAVSGTGATVEVDGFACVAQGKLWELRDGKLATRSLTNLAESPVYVDIGFTEGAPFNVTACGVYAGSPILQLQVLTGGNRSLHIVRLESERSPRADLDLGDVEPAQTKLTWVRRETVDLNGELPRYGLIALRRQKASTLTLVDLELLLAKPVGVPISDYDIVSISMFRDRDEWFVDDRKQISAYSATTGNLLGTHEASDHSLDPGSVGAQQLWIPSDDGDIGFTAVGRDLAPRMAQMPSITRK
jgi:hypothetical protein